MADHTDAMAAAGAAWREETITELVIRSAFPEVKYADFNKNEEGAVGADWLWWWVFPDGTSFGALVQAKNLTFTDAGTPKVQYKHAGGDQLRNLLIASDILEVPAMYAIYFGGPGHRGAWPCKEGEPPGCGYCIQRAVTMVPAMLFTGDLTPTYAAERAADCGIPLERLTGAERWWHRGILGRLRLTRDLEEFLTEPQRGARAVARDLFGIVTARRVCEFSLIEESAPPAPYDADDTITSDRLFTDLPDDKTHNGIEYFEHMLRGLRRTPPGYVLDILNDITPDVDLDHPLAGIVVVTTG